MPPVLSTLNSLMCGVFLCLSLSAAPTEGKPSQFSDDISKCRRITFNAYLAVKRALNGTNLLDDPHQHLRGWVDSIRIECVQNAIWKKCPAHLETCHLSDERIGSELLNGVMFHNESAQIEMKWEELALDGCDISDLRGIRFPSTLDCIYLANNRITDTDLRAMDWTSMSLPRLKSLNLDSNHITNLSGVIFPNDIQHISLSGNFIIDLGRSLVNLKSLRDVCLASNFLSNVPFHFYPNTLSHLNLQSNRITNLSGVIFPNHIGHLNLRNNSIADLGDSLRNLSGLHVLNLADNRLTERAIAGKLPLHLVDLSLFGNGITNLTAVSFPGSIQYLSVSPNVTNLNGVRLPEGLRILRFQSWGTIGDRAIFWTDDLRDRLRNGSDVNFVLDEEQYRKYEEKHRTKERAEFMEMERELEMAELEMELNR